MFTEDDLVDAILEGLKPQPGKDWRKLLEEEGDRHEGKARKGFYLQQPFIKSYTSLPLTRPFVTEYQARKLVAAGQKQVRIPKEAILSPLAQEFFQEKGIQVIRE